ncbi:RICIN domain-containing protein [Shewanella sp. 1_MG-2023]|uniref:RICIN domain-containing protein n=1 Tax=unclassified Shewanella TaxID=196818 RepID=UPI0026E1DCB0|nr:MULTISPECIES: RICIN domain-containing protein [unclassified Shewanella]MDO6612296.1 RICIN domain-containing protein [Shewanella sp. 7_MG-2023]MDO6772150.1 RICIN domain-containing protein [Shewanella sp. 2_MG-2023]MDO6794056.1 RICIN domain-containing protein [Shewanella sp. 1_MG-2023]
MKNRLKPIYKLGLINTSLLLLSTVSHTVMSADWDSIPLPAEAGNGLVWQLNENYSDSFNYSGKNATFTSKWNDTYFNAWEGPGLTRWSSNESWVSDGNLIISASRKAPNLVNAGVITSKTKVKYPIFLEASIKVSNLELSSNFWLLSESDEREIDILEVYGGARETWFAQNMSTNFHVFLRNSDNSIRSDFNDQTHNTPVWGNNWREGFHRFGAYWKSPTDVTFYIDGQETPQGSWDEVVMKDKDYTGAIMNKDQYNMDEEMFIILDTEDHSWRSEAGNVATDADLADGSKNKMYVDWIRVYQPVSDGSGGGSDGGIEANTQYQIKAKHSNKCIDVINSAATNGSTFQQLTCSGNNSNSDQQFKFTALSNGFYSITSKVSNLCLDLSAGNIDNGAKIQQWVCNSSNQNQMWNMIDKGDGYYEIRNSVSNKCLDIAGKSNADGAVLTQWNCYNGDNQRFSLAQ